MNHHPRVVKCKNADGAQFFSCLISLLTMVVKLGPFKYIYGEKNGNEMENKFVSHTEQHIL